MYMGNIHFPHICLVVAYSSWLLNPFNITFVMFDNFMTFNMTSCSWHIVYMSCLKIRICHFIKRALKYLQTMIWMLWMLIAYDLVIISKSFQWIERGNLKKNKIHHKFILVLLIQSQIYMVFT